MYFGQITDIGQNLHGDNLLGKKVKKTSVILDEHNKRKAAAGYVFRCVWYKQVKPDAPFYTLSDNSDNDWIYQECVICPVAMSVTDKTKKIGDTTFRVYELHRDTKDIIANSLQGIRYS